MSQIKYWIWLAGRRGLSAKTRNSLIDALGGAHEIYFAGEADYKRAGALGGELSVLGDKDLDSSLKIMENCKKSGINMLTIQDAGYPVRLRSIYDPPCVLYIIGRLPVMDEEAAIAVVGTRKATPYGIKMGRRMGYEITKGGGLIVSGLAEGVDTAGAEGALRAGGGVIGILGTAIDVVYPRMNYRLFQDVAAVGALVSEYPPGASTARSSFPVRNRILSGMSVGVVVIEAPERSGALITATRALDQGRDLFAVPGNVDSENSKGSNELIKDCAKAVMSGWDVLCEYTGLFAGKIKHVGPETKKIPQEEEKIEAFVKNIRVEKEKPETGEDFIALRRPSTKKVIDKKKDKEYIDLGKQLDNLTESQLKIVSVIEKPLTHVDDIIDLSGLCASSVLSDLTILEIRGVVRQEKGKRFSLNLIKT